jgi:hypothetical protein
MLVLRRSRGHSQEPRQGNGFICFHKLAIMVDEDWFFVGILISVGRGWTTGRVCTTACASSNARLLFRYAQSNFVLGFAISIFETSAARFEPLRIFSFEEC